MLLFFKKKERKERKEERLESPSPFKAKDMASTGGSHGQRDEEHSTKGPPSFLGEMRGVDKFSPNFVSAISEY